MTQTRSPRPPSRAQLLAERALATVERFLHIEAVSGLVLVLAAASVFFIVRLALGSAPLPAGFGA